jgi:hypothetical protein
MPNVPDNAAAPQSTSAWVQIAEALADLLKGIISGMPTGQGGVICRSSMAFGLLFFVLAVIGVIKPDTNSMYGGGIGMVLCMGAIVFFYGVRSDRSLAVGQEARVDQIIGTK